MCAATPYPARLGRYEVFETLAQGRMGPIFRGLDRASERIVVLKTISRERLESYGSAAISRFQNEARAATALHHPGIVEIYECGEGGGLAFVAMEYVAGCGLRERTRVEVADAASLVTQLLDALDYAHDQGVVHRAIKPSNLLLTINGQLRVADFGVARLEPSPTDYMSPELFIGMPTDRRSDIFSAGVVFYELLTGESPFAGSGKSIVDRVCNDKQRSPSVVNPRVPAVFDRVCAKSLAKAASDRYPTARAFCVDLSEAYVAAFGSAIGQTVSSETVSTLTSRPGNSANKAGAPPSVIKSSSSNQIAAFTWPEETLRTVEKQLAKFVGPLARIIVKEAASRTTDTERLYSIAAESLGKEDDRRAFLAQREDKREASVRQSGVGQKIAEAPPAKVVAPSAPTPVADNTPPAPLPSQKSGPSPIAAPKVNAGSQASVKPAAQPGVQQYANPAPKAEPAVKADSKQHAAQPKARAAAFLTSEPESLAAYLKDAPAQVELVIHAFIGTAEALIAMPAANRKNLALVPENIRLNQNGGISIRSMQTTSTQGSSAAVGNPRYAAPEIFSEKSSGEGAVAGAQIYALGMMFYEILLGKTQFEKTFADQRTELDWLRWHADLEKKAPPLKTLLTDCPAVMSDLLESMMEKRVEKRTPSMEAVRTGLREVAQRANKTVILSRPASAPKPVASVASVVPAKKSGNLVLWLILFFVVALGGGVFLWLDPDFFNQAASLFHHLTQ